MLRYTKYAWLLLLSIFVLGCKRDPPVYDQTSHKLVIVVVDGARYQETWGDNTHQYQPYLRDSLQQEGCVFSEFYNNGLTLTIPGHAALLTGHYENISNNGSQLPMYPNLAQLFLHKKQSTNSSAWLVTSKDKLEVFKTCLQPDWKDVYTPMTDCGPSGSGSGYRDDSTTFVHVIQTLEQQHPDFLFVQFREPDWSGHAGDWQGYLNGIKSGDKYAWEIWKWLQSSEYYKGKTTFAITNDHGRHNDNNGGFNHHGDSCSGCRHINLFLAGPGIKKGQIITNTYEQIDFHKTMCRMFGLYDGYSSGKVIKEINAY